MELREYLDKVGDLPEDVLLGRIVLFTISDVPVRVADIRTWFEDLGLDMSLVPSPNKEIDAFKRATNDTKTSYAMTKSRTANLIRREVASNTEFIEHQITREIRDPQNKKLGYTEAIKCRFYRASDPKTGGARVTFKVITAEGGLEPGELPLVQAAARDLYTRYREYVEHLSDQKLRGTVRNYLKHLNAIEIKGGVYFVHSSRDEELAKLQSLVSRLGGGCHMNMIPIVDLERERAFITHIFEREASEALQEITADAKQILTSRKSVSPQAYAKIRERYDAVVADALEHMTNLQITQDLTAASAEVAERALMALQEGMMMT